MREEKNLTENVIDVIGGKRTDVEIGVEKADETSKKIGQCRVDDESVCDVSQFGQLEENDENTQTGEDNDA